MGKGYAEMYFWRFSGALEERGHVGPLETRQKARAERNAGMASNDVGQWASKQAEYQDQFARKRELERVSKDYNRSLTYYMSLGLPFLHQVHQQIRRDGGVIVRGKYLALRYRFLTDCGIRGTI